MGQLEDLQRNRLARMQHIQKGFCGDDNQDDIMKAHNVGDVHPNHPDWVWTQLPNGKYDWRVRKGQAKPAPAPAPKPSGEPDFTPKIPSEIASLTNRSDWDDFDAAYRTLGAEIFKEKFPTDADFQKYVNDHYVMGVKTKADMERYLGREHAGDLMHYGRKPQSKTAQIASMKSYYENKAVKAKEAYQQKKNEAYWAGEGAKRKAEIEKEREAQIAIRKKAVADATDEIQKIMGKNTGYTVNVQLGDWLDYKLGISVRDNSSWDSITLDVRKDYFDQMKGNDFKADLRYSSMTCNCNDPKEVKHVQNLFHCGNLIMENMDKIKAVLIKHGAIYGQTHRELEKLNAELKANH